mgnify:CR=1 FL=1
MPGRCRSLRRRESAGSGKGTKKDRCSGNYEEETPVTIAVHHLDTNHHVNNAQYVDIAREAVTCTKKVKEIRVDYKKAAVLGEVLIPRVTKTGEDERTIVLAGEDKEIRAVVWLKYEEA